jgi:uncharacterized protein involved in exopolysaccharide biosynthesis
MQQLTSNPSISKPKPTTLRDWAAIGFRRRRLIAFSFLFVFTSVVLITLLSPRQYEAEFKIMVKRDRAETLVTPEDKPEMGPPEITELDLNSEVELLKSRDLLEKVVIATGVPSGDRLRVYRAERELERNLTVEPIKKTKLIRVAYRARSPYVAQTVLQTLSRLYFEKHLQVHRPPGALEFFQTQTDQYRKKLNDAEAAMTKFDDDKGVVEAALSREIAVRQLNEFQAELKRNRSAVSETEERIRTLEQQYASSAPRLTAQVRTSPNPLLLQQLKSTLLNLELKRTELLSKFAPDYRPVQEVEEQIAQTREAVDNAEQNPVREETTDRDPTHEWLKSELARSRAELQALQTKVAATTQIVDSYRDQARKLNEAEIAQQDLVRKTKAAEENFLLYSRKQEEARISNALDRRRIVNVSVAQPPSASPSPVGPSRALNLGLGFLFAILLSITLALTVNHIDPSFRTRDEVETFLNVPVLAALPAEYKPGSGAPVAAAVPDRRLFPIPEREAITT